MDPHNNTNRNWTAKANDILFSDSKPLSKDKEPSADHDRIRQQDSRIKSVQNAVKDLQTDVTLIVEMLTIIKGQLSKAVSEVIFPADDWVKLRIRLKALWPTQKGFREDQLKEIIAEQLNLNIEEVESFAIIRIALEKMKNYLRGSLLKTFDEQVQKAIDQFLQHNKQIQPEEVQELTERILALKHWTKTNPTESDIALAKDLISAELDLRAKQGDNADLRPSKKRRLDKNSAIHPGAKLVLPNARAEDENSQ